MTPLVLSPPLTFQNSLTVAFGGPHLFRIVQIQEWIGNEDEIGIEVRGVSDIGNGGCHLPDDEVSGTCREGLPYCIKLHFPGPAEDVTVIIILVGVRILPVSQCVVYQKNSHIHEDTEDSPLIKNSRPEIIWLAQGSDSLHGHSGMQQPRGWQRLP